MSARPKGVPIRPATRIQRPTAGSSVAPAAVVPSAASSSAAASSSKYDDDEFDVPLPSTASSAAASSSRSARAAAGGKRKASELDHEQQHGMEHEEESAGSSRPAKAARTAQDTGPGRGAARSAGGVAASSSYPSSSSAAASSRGGHAYDEDEGEGAALFSGGAGGGAGAGAGAGSSSSSSSSSSSQALVPAAPAAPIVRPVAITKHGVRQYVETQHGLRMFLQNSVASCDLKCSPDLAHIATHARNAEYNPNRFCAVILRMRDPKATALIFASGKMVVTGAKNEEDALTATKKAAKIVQKLGFACVISQFRIQNLVASGDCGFPIRLEGLADEHSKFSSYEPELFPGLIYRMESPRVVLLVFVSGKIVITGSKSRGAVIEAVSKIYPTLFKFRKGTGAGV